MADPSAPTGVPPSSQPPQSAQRGPASPRPRDGLPMPTANPLPLSASQESQVRDIYYDRVRQQCRDEIKAFADCALGRTFSVVFKCRDKNTAMNACLKDHATPQAMDEAREEWFARRAERSAEKLRKAARKAEQEKLLREWWGLQGSDGSAAAHGREDIQAKRRRHEEAKMHLPERIGGLPAKDRPRFDSASASAGAGDSADAPKR